MSLKDLVKARLNNLVEEKLKLWITSIDLTEANVIKMGRIKKVRVRVRKGKVQRNKRVSAVKGYTIRKGKLTRMTSREKLHRKRGARRAKIKRRAKMSRIRINTKRSMRRRKALGIK